jgi:hypothetical protein
MKARGALAFVRRHGVVLASAKGPVPNLAEQVAGAAIRGSWWAHAKAHEIFAVLETVAAHRDVLTCRFVGGRLTFVHRRLWPALVRAAGNFPKRNLARTREHHTATGQHVRIDEPFPEWVSPAVARQARRLSKSEALAALARPAR